MISIQKQHIKIEENYFFTGKTIFEVWKKKWIYSIQEFSGSTIHRDHELNAYSTIVYSVEVFLMKSLTIKMKIINNYGVLRMKILNISTIFLVNCGWKMKNENWIIDFINFPKYLRLLSTPPTWSIFPKYDTIFQYDQLFL